MEMTHEERVTSKRILSAIEAAEMANDYRLDYRRWFTTSKDVRTELEALHKRLRKRYDAVGYMPTSKRYNRLVRVYSALQHKGL